MDWRRRIKSIASVAVIRLRGMLRDSHGRSRFGSVSRIRTQCGLLLLMLTTCQTGGEIKSQADADAVDMAAQNAQDCRAMAEREPEYQVLREHMPLIDIGQADLQQMLDARLISAPERVALARWSHDVQQCGSQVVAMATRNGLSSYVPIVLADRDRRDRILVLLVQRKIAWGEAVLRLKASSTVLQAGITEETSRRDTESRRSSDAERAHRAALLNAFFRLVP